MRDALVPRPNASRQFVSEWPHHLLRLLPSQLPNSFRKVARDRGATIWLKRAPPAKAGTPNYFNISDLICSEATHSITLSDGRVVRKNNVRVRLGSLPPGTFGTPCRLDHERVFVLPAEIRAHQKDLARRHKNSRLGHLPLHLQLFLHLNQPPPDSGASEAEHLRPWISLVRRTTRRRTAVVVPGAVAINAVSASLPRPPATPPPLPPAAAASPPAPL